MTSTDKSSANIDAITSGRQKPNLCDCVCARNTSISRLWLEMFKTEDKAALTMALHTTDNNHIASVINIFMKSGDCQRFLILGPRDFVVTSAWNEAKPKR